MIFRFSCLLLLLVGITYLAHAQDNSPTFEQRPWGSYTVLNDSETFKVKQIDVMPEKRLSYQQHHHRAEYWTIVAGSGKVTLDGVERYVSRGDSIFVPIMAAHRIENIGTDLLQFIEVQIGNYLGEDDIIRIEDDFGRAD